MTCQEPIIVVQERDAGPGLKTVEVLRGVTFGLNFDDFMPIHGSVARDEVIF